VKFNLLLNQHTALLANPHELPQFLIRPQISPDSSRQQQANHFCNNHIPGGGVNCLNKTARLHFSFLKWRTTPAMEFTEVLPCKLACGESILNFSYTAFSGKCRINYLLKSENLSLVLNCNNTQYISLPQIPVE